MYILLENNRVREIIPTFDPIFPGISIEQRYPTEFINRLVQVSDDVQVEHGWAYDPDSSTFFEPTPSNSTTHINLEDFRAYKESEISEMCHTAIVEGCDVMLDDKTVEHFSLEETDQINLTTAFNAIQQGAEGYPYHADGQLCRIYPAADIVAISNAATAHKLYHTTYCNHMMAWARRAETVEELECIVYGAELPEDLAANMAEILTNAAV